MILFGEAVDGGTTPMTQAVTTLAGIVSLGLIIWLKDSLRDKKSHPVEMNKISNLDEQTKCLQEIVTLQRMGRKFGKKQSKKINRKLDVIHEDVIVVKKQTTNKIQA